MVLTLYKRETLDLSGSVINYAPAFISKYSLKCIDKTIKFCVNRLYGDFLGESIL